MQKPTPTHSVSPAHALLASARAVTFAETSEYSEFVAEILRDEEEERVQQASAQYSAVDEFDGRLLRLGHPVAVCAGDDLPDIADGDPTEQAAAQVMDIRVGQLRRYVRELPPLQSKVIRLFWGIGCDRPHSQPEVAAHVGVSQTTVSRTLAAAMAELCRRFEVPADLAA